MRIVIASGKGGVGKSMLASSLAILFAKSKKIVAVDGDVDAPNLHLWLGQGENWDQTEKVSTSERPVISPKKCQNCKHCVDVCPFGALSFSRQSLLILFFARDAALAKKFALGGRLKWYRLKMRKLGLKEMYMAFL